MNLSLGNFNKKTLIQIVVLVLVVVVGAGFISVCRAAIASDS